MVTKTMLRFENLKKSYENKSVLKGVGFSVSKGSIHGFIGPNGAGKTTFMKIIMGGVIADSGKVYLLDKDITKKNIRQYKKIGFMVEKVKFADNLTVEEFCRLAAKVKGVSLNKVEKRLKISDLNQFRKKKCKELSVGWSKILLYFTMVIDEPEIMFLDEPTSGLDPSYREILLSQLELAKSRGVTIIISSHILSDLQRLVDSVTFINKGEVLYNSEERPDNIEKIYKELILSKELKTETTARGWI